MNRIQSAETRYDEELKEINRLIQQNSNEDGIHFYKMSQLDILNYHFHNLDARANQLLDYNVIVVSIDNL